MASCKKCGQPLASNALFCHICGTPVDNAEQTENTTRRHVYAGVVKKCPACGAEMPSVAAVCPACGHEVVESEMAPFLVEFTENLDKCDQSIIEEDKEKRLKSLQHPSGWKSWNKLGKTAWVILNVVTLCFPLVLAYFFTHLQETLPLPSEKLKASLIDNFEVPNEKGAIIDALNLIQGKISSVTAGSINRKSWNWTKLWHAKASQISAKANILLPGDKTADDVFHLISSKMNSFQKKYRIRNAGIAVLAVAYFILVVGSIWFLLSRGLIPFAKLTNSGVLVSPYLWKIYIPLILSLCILVLPQIPSKAKIYIAVLPWIAVLVVSCGTKSQAKKENENTLASAIEEIGAEYSLNLIQYEVQNTWDDALEISFQTNSFDREPIVNAENDIKRANADYHYIIELSFVTEDDLTIRESRIDEHNILKVEEDNTDGFLEAFVELCRVNDLKISYCMKWSDYRMYHFSLRPTGNQNRDYTVFAADAEKLMLAYKYSSVEITIEDSHYKELFKAKFEAGGETEITQTANTEKKFSDAIKPITDNYSLQTDDIQYYNNVVYVTLQANSFDLEQMERFTNEVPSICVETGYSAVIDVKTGESFVWEVICDENGSVSSINVQEFTEEIIKLCEKKGVYLEELDSYAEGFALYIECESSSKHKIDSVEDPIVDLYKKYNLPSLKLYFYNEKESSMSIRFTVIENGGMVKHLSDKTK